MRIKAIKEVGRMPVYDIEVKDEHHYILENGVLSHNSGMIYSADNIFVIKKAQVKDGRDLKGWDFKINIEKSRFSKEKSVLPIRVLYGEPLNPYTGLFDLAVELGWIVKPSNGWWSRRFLDEDTGEIVTEDTKHRRKDIEFDEAFWSEESFFKPFAKEASDAFALNPSDE